MRGSTSYRPATGMGTTNYRNPAELRDSTNYMPTTGMGTTIYRNPTEERDSTYYMPAAGMGTTNFQNSTEEIVLTTCQQLEWILNTEMLQKRAAQTACR